MVGTTPTE